MIVDIVITLGCHDTLSVTLLLAITLRCCYAGYIAILRHYWFGYAITPLAIIGWLRHYMMAMISATLRYDTILLAAIHLYCIATTTYAAFALLSRLRHTTYIVTLPHIAITPHMIHIATLHDAALVLVSAADYALLVVATPVDMLKAYVAVGWRLRWLLKRCWCGTPLNTRHCHYYYAITIITMSLLLVTYCCFTLHWLAAAV